MGDFLITLDSVSYRSKDAAKAAIGAITNRMKTAGGTSCDAAAFCQHVREGRSWVGATFAPSSGNWGEFQQQQIVALDFDNDFEIPQKDGTKRKIQLREGDAGFIDPLEALGRCEDLGLKPLCWYPTLSMKSLEEPRFRLVFDLGEPMDEDRAKRVIELLMKAFPECDKQCSNSNRIFFGSCGEVIECWKEWA